MPPQCRHVPFWRLFVDLVLLEVGSHDIQCTDAKAGQKSALLILLSGGVNFPCFSFRGKEAGNWEDVKKLGPVLSLFKGGYYTGKGLLPSSLKGFLGYSRGKGARLSPCFRAAGMAANRESVDVDLKWLFLGILKRFPMAMFWWCTTYCQKKERRVGGEPCNFSSASSPFIEGSKFRKKNRREEGRRDGLAEEKPFPNLTTERTDRRRRFHGDEMGNGVMYQTCFASPPTRGFWQLANLFAESAHPPSRKMHLCGLETSRELETVAL